MSNSDVAKLLRNVAAAYTIKGENKFRFQIIAYQKAADAIEHASSEIKELWEKDKLDTIPGIGPNIASHLSELFKTGKVKRFEWVMKDVPASLYPLLEVPGFGPKKAYKLVTVFKLKNPSTVIEDIEKHAQKHHIADLEGFGERSEQDILQAILEYKQGKSKAARMALPYAYETAEKIIAYLKRSPSVIEAYPLGSLRRMVATVGDIDIAVATRKPKEAIEYFVKYPHAIRTIEKGSATASILVSGNRQVDLMVQPPQSMGSLLQHFTGSKAHNVKLREYALKKGLSLSEYGIKKKTVNARLPDGQGKRQMANFKTEEEFYKALGMDWIPPEIREGTEEIELVVKGTLPRLIELSDIKGDLHIHSDYPIEPSHDLGRSSMEEMLKKASELKYEYLGFSEHNPSITKHLPNDVYELLTRRKRKIEQLKKSNKSIRIINLLEVDILANGKLAVDDKSLSLLDFALVSIHSSFDQDEKTITKRVLNGLSHPKARILAHPTGRLLNQRPGYNLNWKEVFEFCRTHKKALEINAWPLRLDLPDLLVREAITNGVHLVVNTDSHEVSQMDLIRFGVAVARRGWATKENVINSWGWTKFAEWFNIE